MNSPIQSIEYALTYDDVLLLPQHSKILPHEAQLQTKLSCNIRLHAPILSAAMDTVTESKTAITMARSGGIGVLHKNQSIQEQAAMVRQVKKCESGIVSNPITVQSGMTVAETLQVMLREKISGLPVVDDGKLVGIVTGRDIRFETDLNKKIKDIMTSNVITTKEGTSTEDAIKLLHKHRIEKLPITDHAGTKLLGMFTIRDIQNAKNYPNSSKDSAGRLLVAAAVGTGKELMERCEALLTEAVDVLVVDTAHGHSEGVLQSVRNIKTNFSKKYSFDLIAGNIATPSACIALIEAGADAVKVGIGPGSICTTRIVAGIGVPQFSAVLNCAQAAKKSGIPIIADGGVKFSGDVVKALAAGASTVMIGNLFAGTDEAPGELIIFEGKSYKTYRGMGSIGAMNQGSKDRYMQSQTSDPSKLVPEGIEGRVAYKGSLEKVLFQLTGGIRQAMGYIGAKDIEDLQAKAEFVRISPAGLRESHVHDVHITKEAPNYQLDR